MNRNNGTKKGVVIALAIVSVALISAVAYFSSPTQQAGGVGLSFYSAQSKQLGYVVYATLTNNSTSPVALQRVFFDGSEKAYSTEFLESVGGIWSLKAGIQPTNVLRAGEAGTLLVTSTGANSSITHALRVVTNTSILEFDIETRSSSLAFSNYSAFEGPGIDYLLAYVDNVGTATGNIFQVAVDGIGFEYVHNMRPPGSKYQWSMIVGSNPTPFIGAGQQALIYVSMADVCHTCTHIMKVSCIDGSSVEFVFKLR